jgi:hypothetical protein
VRKISMKLGPKNQFVFEIDGQDVSNLGITSVDISVDQDMNPEVVLCLEAWDGLEFLSETGVCRIKDVKIPDELMPSLIDELKKAVLSYEQRTWKRRKVDVLIEDMELTIRAYNALKKAGINRTEQLSKYTRGQLLNLRGVGRKIVCEIADELERFGLTLADSEYGSVESDAGPLNRLVEDG